MDKKALNIEFWRFLWSSILIALSGCLGNIVDAIIVGRLIGPDGVSAINLSKPMVQFMFTMSILIAGGGGMLVGITLGKKDFRRLKYIYTQSTLSCILIGVVLAILGGWIYPDGLTDMLCSHDELKLATRQYLQPMMFGAPAYLLMWAMSTMVGTDGSPRLVSIAILIDNAVNLALDIVFIKLLGWGIAGSSAATVVGHIFGIILMAYHYLGADNHLRISFEHDNREWGNILSQGMPLAVASICLPLLMFVSNSIVLNTTGVVGIFVFSVCMNLLQIYNLFLAGTCRTLQSLGAIQVGKGDNDAFNFVIRKSFIFISLAMVVTCLAVWMFPGQIAELFGANDEQRITQSIHALRVFALSFIPFCFIYTIMIVYKLFSYHKVALFISFALSLTVIPLLWLFAKFIPQYIWYSYLAAYIIEGLVIFAIHKIGHIEFRLKDDLSV